MSVSRSAMQHYVDRCLIVRLATISKKGTPLLTPLWFARDGELVYMGTRRGSLHARHMSENSRVVMLFEGRNAGEWLRVVGTAYVRDYEKMSFLRKARLAWRYFFRPAALAHFARNWRKLGVRKRYYAERTDPSMVEIALEEGEIIALPHRVVPSAR